MLGDESPWLTYREAAEALSHPKTKPRFCEVMFNREA
jgi:hypothetical protein